MSNALRKIRDSKLTRAGKPRVRKGLNSKGKPPGASSIPSMRGQTSFTPAWKARSKCKRCCGVGYVGHVFVAGLKTTKGKAEKGPQIPCSCIPDAELETMKKKRDEAQKEK